MPLYPHCFNNMYAIRTKRTKQKNITCKRKFLMKRLAGIVLSYDYSKAGQHYCFDNFLATSSLSVH